MSTLHRVQQEDEVLVPVASPPGQILTDDDFFGKTGHLSDAQYAQKAREEGRTAGHQSRHWCFTWNNYPDNHATRLSELSGIEYMVYGYEKAPKTGTPHLQGFIVFHKAQRYGKLCHSSGQYHASSLKGRIPEAYWKTMYSNVAACIKYCKKELNWTEIGEPPVGQGARSDLNEPCDLIVAGLINLEELAQQFPQQMVKYSKGFLSLYTHLQKHRTSEPAVIWLWGPTGKGKTQFAYVGRNPEDVYVKQNGKPFWNGYDQQDVVIINEFTTRNVDIDGWSLTDLLQVLDRYPFNVEVKGSHMKLNSPYIYITSPNHPSDYFPNRKPFDPLNPCNISADFSQVLRRITGIVHTVSESEFNFDERYAEYYFSPSRVVPVTATLPAHVQAVLDSKVSLTRSARMAVARAARAAPVAPVVPPNKGTQILSTPNSIDSNSHNIDPDG